MSPRSRTHTSGSLGSRPWSDCTCEAHTDGSGDLLLLICKDTVLLICHTAENHSLSRSYHSHRAGRGENYFAVGRSIPPNIPYTVFLPRWAYSGTALSRRHRPSRGGTQLGRSHRPCNRWRPARKSVLCRCHTEVPGLLFCTHTAQKEGCRVCSRSRRGDSDRAHIHHHSNSAGI